MPLSLQPALPSSSANGLPAQPVDVAASQPLSFEEVLKVEEKKLHPEINAQSAAAFLATIQPPAMPESIHGLDANSHVESANSVDQPALKTDSVQPAATQPKQNLQIHDQQVAFPEKAGFSVPATQAEQTVEAGPNPALKLKTEPQPKEIDESQAQPATPFTEKTKAVTTPTPAMDVENLKERSGVEIPVDKDGSISAAKPVSFKIPTTQSSESVHVPENTETPNLYSPVRPVVSPTKINAPAAMQILVETSQPQAATFAVAQPVEKAENSVTKTPVEKEPIAVDDNADVKQKAPASETRPLSQKDAVAPELSQTKVPARVVSQAVSKPNTLNEKTTFAGTKSILPEDVNVSAEKAATVANRDKPTMPTATKTAPVQVNPFENKTIQPTVETIASHQQPSKIVISDEFESPQENKPAPASVNISTNQRLQPVKETVVPSAKPVTPEPDVAKKNSPAQMEVSASEMPQPAKETNVPNEKSAMPELDVEKISVPVQMEASASETPQPVKETVASSAKPVIPEPDVTKINSSVQAEAPAQPTKKTVVVPSAKSTMAEPNVAKTNSPAQMKVPASEMAQPAKETVVPSTTSVMPEPDVEKISVPAQMKVSASEMAQPAKETVAPNAKPVMPELDVAKINSSVQMEVSTSEMLQPVKETVAPSSKSAMSEPDVEKISVPAQMEVPAQPAKETIAPSTKSATTESNVAKINSPVQMEVSASEVSQPMKETIAPSAKSVMSESEVAKINSPVQMKVPASEITQPAKETVASSVKPVMPEPDVAKTNSSVQMEVSTSEMAQPTKETVAPSAKPAMPEPEVEKTSVPVQMKVPASEVSQPAKETVVSSVKPVMAEPNAETISVRVQMEAPVQRAKETVAPSATSAMPEPDVKISAPVQMEVSASEVSQPARETVAQSARPMMSEPNAANINSPVQMKVPASEMSQPAKETDVPNAKSAMAEPDVEKISVPVQMKVAASEMSQPVNETVTPSVKSAMPEPDVAKINSPVQAEVPASEMAQPAKETMLKSKDDRSAPALDGENAAAESLFGVGSKPQIKNEAIAFEQENPPVEILPKKVVQSTRVEIKSEEKVSSKESTLDLASNVVIAGNEKGIADVVKKAPVMQVDPTAREVVEQITSHVKARIKSGETSIRMNLNPEKLGAIDVEMTHSAQGVSVSFITEQASTGQLIESQVNQLRQSLKDAGVQLANLNINQHGQSYQEGGGFRQSQQFVQTSQRNVPLVEADEGIQPQRVGQTSEIDYLI